MDQEQLQDWLEQHKRLLLGTLGVFAVLSLVGWTLPQRHSLGFPFLYFYQTDMGIIVDCIGGPCPAAEPQWRPAYPFHLTAFLALADVVVAGVVYHALDRAWAARQWILEQDDRLLAFAGLAAVFTLAGVRWELATETLSYGVVAVLPEASALTPVGVFLASPALVLGTKGLLVTAVGWLLFAVFTTRVRQEPSIENWFAWVSLGFLLYLGVLGYAVKTGGTTVPGFLAIIPAMWAGQVVLRTAGLPLTYSLHAGAVVLYLLALAAGAGVAKAVRALGQDEEG